jgi:hypothetical protein
MLISAWSLILGFGDFVGVFGSRNLQLLAVFRNASESVQISRTTVEQLDNKRDA